jgi:hypothetical protein
MKCLPLRSSQENTNSELKDHSLPRSAKLESDIPVNLIGEFPLRSSRLRLCAQYLHLVHDTREVKRLVFGLVTAEQKECSSPSDILSILLELE